MYTPALNVHCRHGPAVHLTHSLYSKVLSIHTTHHHWKNARIGNVLKTTTKTTNINENKSMKNKLTGPTRTPEIRCWITVVGKVYWSPPCMVWRWCYLVRNCHDKIMTFGKPHPRAKLYYNYSNASYIPASDAVIVRIMRDSTNV